MAEAAWNAAIPISSPVRCPRGTMPADMPQDAKAALDYENTKDGTRRPSTWTKAVAVLFLAAGGPLFFTGVLACGWCVRHGTIETPAVVIAVLGAIFLWAGMTLLRTRPAGS